eukprot:Skav218596  [mRNA]  locus=scaffold3628:80459:87676:+ [translate_table: standard]
MKRVRAQNLVELAAADPAATRKLFHGDDLGLSFYELPPSVSVRQFEDFTASRLKLLHAIDRTCNSQELRLEIMKEQIRPKLAREFRESGLELGAVRDADCSLREDIGQKYG